MFAGTCIFGVLVGFSAADKWKGCRPQLNHICQRGKETEPSYEARHSLYSSRERGNGMRNGRPTVVSRLFSLPLCWKESTLAVRSILQVCLDTYMALPMPLPRMRKMTILQSKSFWRLFGIRRQCSPEYASHDGCLCHRSLTL
jgi:hypothetical protein